jgi:hypothetical protein
MSEQPPIKQVATKASRVSKEFIATVISLVTTAFGVVVALAWNSALSKLFEETLSPGGALTAQFIYAVLVTCIGVAVIVVLSRIAARIDAEPVEFKYPAPKKDPDGEAGSGRAG